MKIDIPSVNSKSSVINSGVGDIDFPYIGNQKVFDRDKK